MTNELNYPHRTLHIGDNLPWLRSINSESIDLIATDPPFNSNATYEGKSGQFEDANWADIAKQNPQWLEELEDFAPLALNWIDSLKRWNRSMHGYLAFMAPRSIHQHRTLKRGAALYLHCDPSANGYLRQLNDMIFDHEPEREIIWKNGTLSGGKSRARNWVRQHDTILYYIKGRGEPVVFNKQFTEYSSEMAARYKYVDEDGRRYRYHNSAAQSIDKRVYMNEGVPRGTVISDIKSKQNVGATGEFAIDYPTQKPLSLYDLIINTSTNEGDVVCDPFAGSGTTLISAENLGRRWIGAERDYHNIKKVESRFEHLRIGTLEHPEAWLRIDSKIEKRTDRRAS